MKCRLARLLPQVSQNGATAPLTYNMIFGWNTQKKFLIKPYDVEYFSQNTCFDIPQANRDTDQGVSKTFQNNI